MSVTTMTQSVMAEWLTLQGSTDGLPKLWLGETPPAQSQMPLAIYQHRGEKPVYPAKPVDGKPNQISGAFTLKIYNTGGVVGVESLSIPVRDALVNDALSIDAPQEIFLWRTDYRLSESKVPDAQGNPVYVCEMDYSVIIGNPSG